MGRWFQDDSSALHLLCTLFLLLLHQLHLRSPDLTSQRLGAPVLGSKTHRYLNVLIFLNPQWDVREFEDVQDLENTGITQVCCSSAQVLDTSPSIPGFPLH